MDAVTTTPGAEFARALAEKNFEQIVELLDLEVDFRGMTPSRAWEASDPAGVVGDVLTEWFEEPNEILALESVAAEPFADVERVGYRFRVRNPDGVFLVDQQAYVASRDGRITWMRVLCSGFRPIDPSD